MGNCCIGLGDRVLVSPLEGPVPDAIKINLISVIKGKEETENKELLNTFLAANLVGRYLSIGNIISISMYSKLKKYRVTDILPKNNDDSQIYKMTTSTLVQLISTGEPSTAPNKTQSEHVLQSEQFLSYSSIGGLKSELETIREMVELPLKHPNLFQHFGIRPPRGVLMHGPPGTGKTMIARVLAKQMGCSVYIINGPEVTSKYFGESEAKLRDIFTVAAANAPSLIFIDEIDALAPKRSEETNGTSKRIVGTLLTLLDGLGQNDRIVVLAATNQPNAIDIALRRPGRFDREIEIGIPTRDGRMEILEVYLRNMPHQLSDDQIKTIGDNTHGYVGADLSQLCKQAAINTLRRTYPAGILSASEDQPSTKSVFENYSDLKVSYQDFLQALNEVQPSAMREIQIDIATVTWDDIGGYADVKHQMKETVEWPIKFPEKFTQFGIKPPRGILLYGPPGCSKTLFAKALATEAGLNFIPVQGPELFSKYVGDSEKAVRDIFRKARAASPSIIFFDEIDALAIERGDGDGTTVQDRVLSQMLNELDGISPLNNVLFLAATNRPDIIDKALMRPGRIDRIVYIPPPDSEARKAIFQIHCRKMKVSSDLDLDILTKDTEGYSGAEIVQVCSEAVLHALRVNFDTNEIEQKDFEAALKLVRPRTTQKQIDFYTNYQNSKI